MNCPECHSTMQSLFYANSLYCPNECDLKTAAKTREATGHPRVWVDSFHLTGDILFTYHRYSMWLDPKDSLVASRPVEMYVAEGEYTTEIKHYKSPAGLKEYDYIQFVPAEGQQLLFKRVEDKES